MNKTLSLSLWITSVLLAAMCVPAAAGAFEFTLAAPAGSDILEFHDELVRVAFFFSQEDGPYNGHYKRIGFTLVNLCPEAIAVDWDMCSITLSSGEAGNVVQEGVRFLAAGELKPPTTIPPGSRLTTSVMPTASIDYSSPGGWTVGDMELYDGASIGFYLSLLVHGERHGYDFRFNVRKAPNVSPAARISVNSEGGSSVVYAPAPHVDFSGSRSTDADGFVRAYRWDFGDGTTGFGISVTHTYAGLGPYLVELVVFDNEAATNTTRCMVTVYLFGVEPPPAAQLGAEAASPPVTQPGTEVVPPPNATRALATAAVWVRFFILLGFATGVLGFLLGEW